jgi:carbamoyl-phosphate synthase large subunit
MKSTGEVMGVGRSFGEAFSKAQAGAGAALPIKGRAFLSVRNRDKSAIIEIAEQLLELGFKLVATGGTAEAIEAQGIEVTAINKVGEGRPHIVDAIKNQEINLIINTTEGKQAIVDSYTIRGAALQHKVAYTTTIAGARATCLALQQMNNEKVCALQELHKEINR